MKTLDLKGLLQMLLRKWWIIAIAVFVCSGAALAASLYLLEPVYQSNTTIYIVNADISAQKADQYMDLLIGNQIIRDYRELAKSRLVANQVLKDLKLDNITIEAFSEKVSVDLKNDTRVIQISAMDASPKMAKLIADKVTDVFIKKVVEIMQAMDAKVIDRAEIPKKPIKPKKVKNTAAAAALGLILGFCIVFLIDFFDNNIRTAEDIKVLLDLPVIGMIPVFSKDLKGGP